MFRTKIIINWGHLLQINRLSVAFFGDSWILQAACFFSVRLTCSPQTSGWGCRDWKDEENEGSDWKRFVVFCFKNDSYNNIGLELQNSWKKSHYSLQLQNKVCFYCLSLWNRSVIWIFDIQPGECRQKDPRKLLEVVSDTFKWYFHKRYTQ